MNWEANLRFLSRHQPLPDFPDDATMRRYKAATEYFYYQPDPRCIPLFLNSFSTWDDLTVYDSVQSVLRKFSITQVLPHLISGCRSKHPAVRLWCVDTARFFPHESLVPVMAHLLAREPIATRLACAVVLECINSDAARKAAARALINEKDEDVREVLESC